MEQEQGRRLEYKLGRSFATFCLSVNEPAHHVSDITEMPISEFCSRLKTKQESGLHEYYSGRNLSYNQGHLTKIINSIFDELTKRKKQEATPLDIFLAIDVYSYEFAPKHICETIKRTAKQHNAILLFDNEAPIPTPKASHFQARKLAAYFKEHRL